MRLAYIDDEEVVNVWNYYGVPCGFCGLPIYSCAVNSKGEFLYYHGNGLYPECRRSFQ